MQIVYADGKVTKSEINFVTNVISALQLEPTVVQDLFNLFETHTPSVIEWNDFMESRVEEERKKFQTIL
jgi:RNAse (barnase) inhibitor barstar